MTQETTGAQKPADKLFRRKALDAISNPSERLDEIVRVTSPRGWIALTSLVAVVIAAVLYGLLGSSPATVSGQGLFLPPGGLVRVESPVGGTVIHAFHGEEEIAVGGEVAVIDVPGEGEVLVASTVAGHVTELLVAEGNVVAAGDPIAVLEPENEAVTVIAYVPAAEGKSIEPGMRVDLSPSTAPSESYGRVLGTVISISEFPVSPERLDFIVQNEFLSRQITGQGSVLEVQVEVALDDSTPSGLKWSSGDGPPFAIDHGTITSIAVVIEDSSPASRFLGQ